MIHLDIQGTKVPALGFGTWQLTGDDCVRGVAHALDLGYRHIDTAEGYSNHVEVGKGLRQGGVDREDIFLTTKVPPDKLGRNDLPASTDEYLRELKVDYVDLLLVHWPNPDIPVEETMAAMRQVQEAGKARHIGVSNFPPSLVEEAGRHARIFCNQVEYHPFLAQDKLVAQACEMDYMLTAYSPLARGQAMKNTTLKEIGQAHGKNPAQVVLRWLIQQDHVAAIPKAGSDKHRQSNFDIFDFELSEKEMRRIQDLNREERLIDPDSGPAWER